MRRIVRGMDLKDYQAMEEKATMGERIAFVIIAFAFLVALSHITERDLCAPNQDNEICNEVQVQK